MIFGNNIKTTGDADKEKINLRKEAEKDAREAKMKLEQQALSQKRLRTDSLKKQIEQIKGQIAFKENFLRKEKTDMGMLQKEASGSVYSFANETESKIKELDNDLTEVKNEIASLNKKILEETREKERIEREEKRLVETEKTAKEKEKRETVIKRTMLTQKERIIDALENEIVQLKARANELERELASLK